ncbi:MAG: competence/damage-inducible protein A [Elusimicrobiaceae bacterium]
MKTKSPGAALIFTGSELLNGKSNTYVPLLSAKLKKLGVRVLSEHTLPDEPGPVKTAIENALRSADIVITVGGLGPTFDDVTRDAATAALKRELVFNARVMKQITSLFKRRGRPMPEKNRIQALIIAGAEILDNITGTAPGQLAREKGKILILLPGPKSEWEPMFDGQVARALKKAFPAARENKTLEMNLAGLAESAVDEKLDAIRARFKKADFTILSAPGHVRIIASARGGNAGQILRAIGTLVRKEYGNAVYGVGELPVEAALGKLLVKRGLTIATAESCTGGLVSAKITRVAGSSRYMNGAIVAYSNAVKTAVLGVSPETLEKHGAVSEECALEMARGARKAAKADIGVSTTGIAGPGGATKTKPVGLVYIAFSSKNGREQVRECRFGGTRNYIQENAANAALIMAMENIILHPPGLTPGPIKG